MIELCHQGSIRKKIRIKFVLTFVSNSQTFSVEMKLKEFKTWPRS
jgi:hypothetical protein